MGQARGRILSGAVAAKCTGNRVTSFRTDHGYVDASGRPLR
jgi:hypothetical protein